MRTTSWFHAVTIVTAALAAGYAGAQTDCNWTNTGTGSWAVSDNWDPDVPTAIDTAILNNGGTAEVDTSGAVAHRLLLGQGGGGSLVVKPTGDLTIAATGIVGNAVSDVWDIAVEEGGTLNVDGSLYLLEGTGSLTLDGGNMNVSNRLSLAGWFRAPLHASAVWNGDVIFEMSGGTLTPDIFSMAMMNSSKAVATMSGGTLIVNELSVGTSAGSVSTAIFRQTGGTIICGDLYVCKSGNTHSSGVGTNLLETSGGTITANFFSLAHSRGTNNIDAIFGGTSVVNVGSATTCNADNSMSGMIIRDDAYFGVTNGTFLIGSRGRGTVTVEGGVLEVANNRLMRLGSGVNALGRLVIDGGTVLSGEMQVGYSNSPGEVHVNSGRLDLGGRRIYLGYATGSSGTMVQSGGTVTVHRIYFGFGHGATTGVYTQEAGVLKSTLIQANIPNGVGSFHLNGGVFAVDEYDQSMGSLTNNGATISPAYTNFGVVKIESGNYEETSPDCVIDIQIGGKTRGTSYDWMHVVGTATLAGSLDVSLEDYDPDNILPADEFHVVEANEPIQGAFRNVASGQRLIVGGTHTFLVYYGVGVPPGFDANRVTLTDFQPIPKGSMIIVR